MMIGEPWTEDRIRNAESALLVASERIGCPELTLRHQLAGRALPELVVERLQELQKQYPRLANPQIIKDTITDLYCNHPDSVLFAMWAVTTAYPGRTVGDMALADLAIEGLEEGYES